jgi:uncharacterized membrane protein (UPF0127 family)
MGRSGVKNPKSQCPINPKIPMIKTDSKFIMRKFFAVALFVVIIFVAFFCFAVFNKKEKLTEVCFKNNCFHVKVASTPSERERGLMFVESMKRDKGMLFVFEKQGNYFFWMKNTLIPLDIIWIDGDKKVVFIKENAQPCSGEEFCPSINPGVNALYVLELNAGMAQEIGLKLGDTIFWGTALR